MFTFVNGHAQDPVKDQAYLEGFWQGGLIKGNSLCLFTADFSRQNDTLWVETNIPEWTWYESNRQAVNEGENGAVSFKTWFGTAELVLDGVYSELLGKVGETPFHLKKVLRPALPALEKRELVIDMGDYKSKAVLYLPAIRPAKIPLAIFVQGRGCSGRNTFQQRPQVLASYGIATLAFDKRGAKGTATDCSAATMAQHAKDLARVVQHCQGIKAVNSDHVGLITFSAGGWVGIRAMAQESSPVAFLVSVVGPSTSVEQQQVDCSVYYTREVLGGSQLAIDEAVEYARLMFDTSRPDKIVFEEMMALLARSETNGWRDVLEDTDVPVSAEALSELWVRRNIYDPAEDLKKYKGPHLVVLGGKDFVVSVKENVSRYEELYREVGKTNYRIAVLPGAGHGLEHGTLQRVLEKEGEKLEYTKFDRVAAGALQEIVDFLQAEGLLTR